MDLLAAAAARPAVAIRDLGRPRWPVIETLTTPGITWCASPAKEPDIAVTRGAGATGAAAGGWLCATAGPPKARTAPTGAPIRAVPTSSAAVIRRRPGLRPSASKGDFICNSTSLGSPTAWFGVYR